MRLNKHIYILALSFCLFHATACLGITPTGTTIESQTEMSYSGGTYISSEVLVIVGQMYGITVEPNTSSAYDIPGATRYFHYMLTNLGNGSDSILYYVSVATPEGWTFSLIKDDNGNCTHDAGETTPLENPLSISEEGLRCFFVAISVPTAESTGVTGEHVVHISGEGIDGGTYIGANGTIYGGVDSADIKTLLTVEALSNFRINRDDTTGQIYLTWNGGTADIYCHNGTFEASQSSYSLEASGVPSPYYCASIESKDGKIRYYRAALSGSTSYAPQTVGKFDIPVVVGLNQLSSPFVLYATDIKSLIGTQVKGAAMSSDADKFLRYNPAVQGRYEMSWLVDDAGPEYDGEWFSGNYPSTTKINTDEGWFLQIMEESPATYITLVGEVSNTNRSIPLVVGLQMVGSCFPLVSTFEGSGIIPSGLTGAIISSVADRIWTYNASTQGRYDIAWLVGGTGLEYDGQVFSGNYPTNMTLTPGKGYWVQIRSGHSPFTWNYIKPY